MPITPPNSKPSGHHIIPLYGPAPQPLVERKATNYQNVNDTNLNSSAYLMNVRSFHHVVTSPGYCQGLLRHEGNFSSRTEGELFELSEGGTGRLISFDDHELVRRLDFARTSKMPKLRIFFLTLEDVKLANFGCQLSAQRDSALCLLKSLSVNPHFVQFMVAKPDYLAPFNFHHVGDGSDKLHEFMCQFPRWHIHTRQQPCSLYMQYNQVTRNVTYIVVSGRDEEFVQKAKRTLTDCFASHSPNGPALSKIVADPYFFMALLFRESLADSEGVIRRLRLKLYDQLDIVGTYADRRFDRVSLRNVTNELHKISQDCESLYASAEMLAMVVKCMAASYKKLPADDPTDLSHGPIPDDLTYLGEAVEAQKRWLRSYASRKDTAMNLVYNLVTQHDSETNTVIARSMKDDSHAMKVIAIMTMIFLPSTLVTSFFGMAFFNTTDSGDYLVSDQLWTFAVVCVPLTLSTIAIWYLWWKWPSVKSFIYRFRYRARQSEDTEREAGAQSPDPASDPLDTAWMESRKGEDEKVATVTIT